MVPEQDAPDGALNILDDLAALGEEKRGRQEEYVAWRDRAVVKVREAIRAGEPLTVIADRLGVSRTGLYAMLANNPERES